LYFKDNLVLRASQIDPEFSKMGGIMKVLPCTRTVLVCLALWLTQSSTVLAQAPGEIPALKSDYAKDMLCLFSWALDIKFTDTERTRFIKERELEWESGDLGWQCQFIGDYWTFISDKAVAKRNKEPMKKRLLDFVIANAKANQPDMVWIQKRLGQDDEIDDLPVSDSRRSTLDKVNGDTVLDSVPYDDGLVKLNFNLKAFDVANCLSKVCEMFQVPLTLEQKSEFVERAKKHWRKYREDWSDRGVSTKKILFSYVNDSSTYFVYARDLKHNQKALEEFAERGDRDSIWLLKIFKESAQRTPLLESEPMLSRSVIRAYASLRVAQLNEVVGQRVLTADTALAVNMIKEVLAKWSTLPAIKRSAILDAPRALASIIDVYPHFIPLYQEFQKEEWGRDLVLTTPQIKPIVDARSKAFADIAKKDPNWKSKMEENNMTAFRAYLARDEANFQRMMKMSEQMFDSMVFSNKMNAIHNAILRAPNGTTVNIQIHP
jgi:hypothetical protein